MKLISLVGVGVFTIGFLAMGAETPPEATLEDKLSELSVEANELPSIIPSERMYSVQNRYNPLRARTELSVGGAKNFNADSFLVSQEIDLNVRHYLTDRWFLSLGGSYVTNEWSRAGEALIAAEGKVPDVAYAKYRSELLGGYHTFYGKIRFSMDSVVYFDQYVALGPGFVQLQTGNQWGAVADVGFAFWMGKQFSLRVGMKDYFIKEQRVASSDMAHHLLGHVDFGLVLGGS